MRLKFKQNNVRWPCYDGGVKLGFEGTWQRKDIFETLETAKELAAKSDSSHACFEINGVMYVMQASSAREGNVYKYVFEGDGVKYYVHSNPKKNIQPVRIRYNAEGLIGRDLFLKHYDTLQTLENMGFRVTGEKLTRVDMQVMLPISMEELFYMGRGSRVTISCAAQNEDYRYKCGVLQTFTMGNIDTQEVCCYDKRAELFHAMKREPVKFALMLQECLGPDFVTSETPLTRVEFGISCPLRTKSPSDYLFPRFVERLRKHRW